MKKIGLLVMALVLALGAMGAAFALWSDTLFLDVTVNTGNIGLEWTNDLPPYDDEAADKDASNVTSSVSADGKTFTIIITNAYPNITYTIPFDLHGTGSVPVHTRFDVVPGSNMDMSWITVPDLSGMQVHQGLVINGVITIHLDNTALQGMTYFVFYELVYWQYNEPGPPQ